MCGFTSNAEAARCPECGANLHLPAQEARAQLGWPDDEVAGRRTQQSERRSSRRATVAGYALLAAGLFTSLLLCFTWWLYDYTNPGYPGPYQEDYEYGFGAAPVVGAVVALVFFAAAAFVVFTRRWRLAAVFALIAPLAVAVTVLSQWPYLRENLSPLELLFGIAVWWAALTAAGIAAFILVLLDARRHSGRPQANDVAQRQEHVGGT